jgi:hypothetical protein
VAIAMSRKYASNAYTEHLWSDIDMQFCQNMPYRALFLLTRRKPYPYPVYVVVQRQRPYAPYTMLPEASQESSR